jgi:hypothetical protein
MLEVVVDFIDAVIPEHPFLLAGESYGATVADKRVTLRDLGNEFGADFSQLQKDDAHPGQECPRRTLALIQGFPVLNMN